MSWSTLAPLQIALRERLSASEGEQQEHDWTVVV